MLVLLFFSLSSGKRSVYIFPAAPAFALIVGAYAAELGMTGTNFENSTGLPGPQHYTTARDLATLARALIRETQLRVGLHGYENSTLEQVANELGVTRERVRQIQMDALKRLRGILEQDGFSIDAIFK